MRGVGDCAIQGRFVMGEWVDAWPLAFVFICGFDGVRNTRRGTLQLYVENDWR